MDIAPGVSAALVAAIVSIIVAVISFLANRSQVQHEVRQTQFKDIIAKRIDIYPELWRTHIHYETNWVLENKPKTREWAEQYVSALNEFNLKGGLFFSEDLYRKFHELRACLYDAIQNTQPNSDVDEALTTEIRGIVYGKDGPGLSTYLKDDLGSYRSVTLERRANRA